MIQRISCVWLIVIVAMSVSHPCEHYLMNSTRITSNTQGFISFCPESSNRNDYINVDEDTTITVFACIPRSLVTYTVRYNDEDGREIHRIDSNNTSYQVSEWMYRHNFSSESLLGQLRTVDSASKRQPYDSAFPIDFDHHVHHHIHHHVMNYTCITGKTMILSPNPTQYHVYVYYEYGHFLWYDIATNASTSSNRLTMHRSAMRQLNPLFSKSLTINVRARNTDLTAINARNSSRRSTYTDSAKHGRKRLCRSGFNKGYWDVTGNWIGYNCSYQEDLYERFDECSRSYSKIVWIGDSNSRRCIKYFTKLYQHTNTADGSKHLSTTASHVNNHRPYIWCYNDSKTDLTTTTSCACDDKKDKWPFQRTQVGPYGIHFDFHGGFSDNTSTDLFQHINDSITRDTQVIILAQFVNWDAAYDNFNVFQALLSKYIQALRVKLSSLFSEPSALITQHNNPEYKRKHSEFIRVCCNNLFKTTSHELHRKLSHKQQRRSTCQEISVADHTDWELLLLQFKTNISSILSQKTLAVQ